MICGANSVVALDTLMLRRFAHWLNQLTSYFYLGVAAIVLLDTASRYLFASPTTWALEISLILCGIQFLVSGIGATASDSHIRIDSLHRLLPHRLKRIASDIAPFAALLFLGAIVYSGSIQAYPAITSIERTGSVLNSPMPLILKVLIPVVAAAMAVLVVVQIINRICRKSNDGR